MYLSVCISSRKHNGAKIESSNLAFIATSPGLQVKVRVGRAWYSQMYSQTGCLHVATSGLKECFIQDCMMMSFYHAI